MSDSGCQVLNAQEEARERMLQEEEEDLLSGDEGVDEGALDSDDGPQYIYAYSVSYVDADV